MLESLHSHRVRQQPRRNADLPRRATSSIRVQAHGSQFFPDSTGDLNKQPLQTIQIHSGPLISLRHSLNTQNKELKLWMADYLWNDVQMQSVTRFQSTHSEASLGVITERHVFADCYNSSCIWELSTQTGVSRSSCIGTVHTCLMSIPVVCTWS